MAGVDRLTLVKFITVLVAALIIGNWFLAEVRKAKLRKEPWYKPHISIAGLIILAALSLPLIFLFFTL